MINIPEQLIERLKKAKSVAVLTGAGISAESGVPTFRGEEGLWKKFRAEELATVDAFMNNPELVWEWYLFRRDIVSKVTPNPGHYVLAEFDQYFEDFTLITQNVDGLHNRAGSENILELHGNITRNKCFDCNKPFHDSISLDSGKIPRCDCGGRLRPDVVWFGELLPSGAINKAYEASGRAEIFFSIGTSAIVHPAASLPLAAQKEGAYLVEINLEPTPLTDFSDCSLIGKSGEVLPLIAELLK